MTRKKPPAPSADGLFCWVRYAAASSSPEALSSDAASLEAALEAASLDAA